MEIADCSTKRPISVVIECGILPDSKRADVWLVQNRSTLCLSTVVPETDLYGAREWKIGKFLQEKRIIFEDLTLLNALKLV